MEEYTKKDLTEIFKKNIEEYKLNMVPTKNYMKQMTKYIESITNLDKKEAKRLLKKIINSSNKKNPEVIYRDRNRHGDRTMKKISLTDYINDAIKNNDILTPNFAIVDHPSKRKSLHSEFLASNIAKRKVDKKNMFKYKQQGNMEMFKYYNVLQKVRKIFNNSLSGAYASPSTILYFPTAHSVLTSMTRSVASIGNAITESMVAGNKLLRTPEITINYIISIITEANIEDIKITVRRFNLHYPTPDEVYKALEYSFINYWHDSVKIDEIKSLLSNLSKEELAAVLYINDLYNIKKYNDEMVKDMLHKLSNKVVYNPDVHTNIDADNILGRLTPGVLNLAYYICTDELEGKELKDISDNDKNTLALTANNVAKYMLRYKKLFRTFFTTNILPPNIANVKEMLRDVIVLSDTDSTCGSYDQWVEWYYGNTKYTSKAIALAAAVMTINSEAMDHNIKIFAKNMNADNSLIDLLEMKNEFFWSSFTTANVSKHYYADVRIQEGNVFKEPDLELKGVHLIASTINGEVRDIAYNMVREINYKVANDIDIYPEDMINKVIEVEKIVLNKIKQGDTDIFKTEKIKPIAAYKIEDPGKNNYFHHMLWNAAFKDKYGDPGEPEYRVIKINTTLENKQAIEEFANTLEGRSKDNFLKLIKKYNKNKLGILRLPINIVSGKGIPDEVMGFIDRHKIISDNLNIFYIILESIGIYTKPGTLLMDIY